MSSFSDSCIICGKYIKIIWHEDPFLAYQCTHCGFIRSFGESLRQYDQTYFQMYEVKRSVHIAHFQNLIQSLPVEIKPPVLDFGAGIGNFLSALPSEMRHEAFAVESSAYARQHLERLQLAGVFSSMDGIVDETTKFSTITLWDVIAHVENPIETLKILRNRLADDGILVIKTPYHPLRAFKIANLLRSLHKGHSLLHIPSMSNHFTPTSLKTCLETVSLRPYKWQWASESPIYSWNDFFGRAGLLRLGRHLSTGKITFIMTARAISSESDTVCVKD